MPTPPETWSPTWLREPVPSGEVCGCVSGLNRVRLSIVHAPLTDASSVHWRTAPVGDFPHE